LYLHSFDSRLDFKLSQSPASSGSLSHTGLPVEPAVYRLSAFRDGSKANTYLLELRFPAVNIRRDMTLAEDVRVCQYDAFIIFWYTDIVIPIILIIYLLAVRFMQIKTGI